MKTTGTFRDAVEDFKRSTLAGASPGLFIFLGVVGSLATIVLMVLKLLGTIRWHWFLVFEPFEVFLLFAVLGAIGFVYSWIVATRNR